MQLELFCKQWLNAWTGNNPDLLFSFYSANAFYRDPARPQGLTGQDLYDYFKKLLAKNPHWIWRVSEIIPTEKGFCLKWTAEIPHDNKIIFETGLDIVELEDGKIVRNEVFFDRTQFLKL